MIYDGLTDDENELVDSLVKQLNEKRWRNEIRASHYDGKHAVRDLGISTPPEMRRLALVLGWPAKAVDILARRTRFAHFVGDSAQSLDALVHENRMGLEVAQAITSAYVHAVSFLIVTRGGDGEPGVLVTGKDAMSATGMWDERRRALSSLLSVQAWSAPGAWALYGQGPYSFALYLPGETVLIESGQVVDRQKHDVDGVPAEPLVYKPRLGRPFGSSRISRPVMSITESALRTMLRSEVSAEFYSAPQRWAMGADETMFQDANGNPVGKWQSIMGRVWALPLNDADQAPTVGQFPQMTQQPHMDQLRAWAQLFAGETSIPVGSLGISADSNPTSAEAFEAARDDLLSEAEAACEAFATPLARIGSHMLTLAGMDAGRPMAQFRDPRYTSKAAAADATVKLVTAFPWMADSDAAIEMLGYDETTTNRLLADKRRLQARATLNALTGNA